MSTASNKQTNDADVMTAHNDIGSIGKGILTPEDIDNAEEEICGIDTTIKSYYWTGGHKNGHLADVITKEAYWKVINDPEWDQYPLKPLAKYNPDAVVCDTDERPQLEVQWKRKMSSQETSAGVQEDTKALIIYAFRDNALSTLKKRIPKYSATTSHTMITHLCTKACIKLTTLEKFKLKTNCLQNITIHQPISLSTSSI